MKIQRMNLARRLIWAVVMGVIVCACLLYLVETPRSATYNVQVLSGERMVVNGVEYGDGHDFKACPEMRPREYVLTFHVGELVSMRDFCFAQWSFASEGLDRGVLMLGDGRSIEVRPESPDYTVPGMQSSDYTCVWYTMGRGRYTASSRVGQEEMLERFSTTDKIEFLRFVEIDVLHPEVKVYVSFDKDIPFVEMDEVLTRLRSKGCDRCFLSAMSDDVY